MNRKAFVAISQAGICDEKNRALALVGYKGRIVAVDDSPVTTFVVAAMQRTQEFLGWTSVEAARSDIDKAIEYLKKMRDDVSEKE